MEKGVWKCFAGCGEGGMVAFEMKFSKCDEAAARSNIAGLVGRNLFSQTEKPEAIYQYHDARGVLVFEKLRYPGKRFVQRRPTGKGGYEYKLGAGSKPLYHLPELLVANEIAICEGEKDADNVRALNLGGNFAATTNFDGAGKWKDEYSVFFAGKKVVIFPDNDEIGKKHAEQVARSVHRYALGVKIVDLPTVDQNGDVSDYLKSHGAAELMDLVVKSPQWHPPTADSGVLIPSEKFIATVPDKIDWLVENVIERGANGFFCAVPKGGKSWAAVDLALSLAMGCQWLGFAVPRPVKVALITREDNPALTSWRMKHLMRGKMESGGDIRLANENLYVNSRQQTPEFMLDQPEQVAEMVAAIKERGIEFALFDVFNVMHAADENDNTEMRGILRFLSQIQAEVSCSIGVVHHFNKAETGSMTQRLRGASSIAGWAEWLIGISIVDETTKLRSMDFELKAAQPPDAVTYKIVSNDANGVASLQRTQ